MRGVNKAIIVGTLGKDPEMKYTQSGTAIASFSVATNESWKDKQTGEQKEKTEWHRISMFGKLAEIAGEYLKTGSQVYLEGKIETQKWQDQNGNDRYTTQINCNQMQMLGGRSDANTEQRSGTNPPPMQPSPNNPHQTSQPEFDDVPF